MNIWTEEMARINGLMFDLVTEMAASGDERCQDLEDLRADLLKIYVDDLRGDGDDTTKDR